MSYTAATQLPPGFATVLLGVALTRKEIGERIKSARDANGETQLSFAIRIGVSPSTVSKWERGQLPPVRELLRVADELGIEPAVLVEPAPTEVSQLASLQQEVAELHEMVAELLRRGV